MLVARRANGVVFGYYGRIVAHFAKTINYSVVVLAGVTSNYTRAYQRIHEEACLTLSISQ